MVCEWIGNSEEVARKHYLQVTEEHFQKATSNPTSHMRADESKPRHTESETAVLPAIEDCTAVQVPPRGLRSTFFRFFPLASLGQLPPTLDKWPTTARADGSGNHRCPTLPGVAVPYVCQP